MRKWGLIVGAAAVAGAVLVGCGDDDISERDQAVCEAVQVFFDLGRGDFADPELVQIALAEVLDAASRADDRELGTATRAAFSREDFAGKDEQTGLLLDRCEDIERPIDIDSPGGTGQ